MRIRNIGSADSCLAMRAIFWPLGCLLVLVAPLRSAAHGLGAECKVNGSRVELEAYYDDNTPARDARVYVEDAEHQLLAAGRTDADGRWSFARPGAGAYRVIVDAGAGHRKELKFTLAVDADVRAGRAGTRLAPV